MISHVSRSDHRLDAGVSPLSRPWHGKKNRAPCPNRSAQLPRWKFWSRSRHRARPARQARGLQWQTWPASAATIGQPAPAGPRRSGNRRFDRARAFIAGERSVSRSCQGQRLRLSWPPSLPTAMRADLFEISPETGAGASSCPMTASTSSSPSAKECRTAKEPTSSIPKSFSPISVCWRSIRRRRKRGINTLWPHRHARTEARASRDAARLRPSGWRLALRSITDVNATAEAIRNMKSVNVVATSIRHRSDRMDLMKFGESHQRCEPYGGFVVGRRRA